MTIRHVGPNRDDESLDFSAASARRLLTQRCVARLLNQRRVARLLAPELARVQGSTAADAW